MSDDSSVRSSAQSALTPAASDITDPMQQNARPCINKKNEPDPSLPKPLDNPELTQRQLGALGLLLQGLSDAAVADKLAVDRSTIYRWRTLNTTFRWELDRLRRECLAHSADRLRALLSPSLDILANHLHSTDPRVSLRTAALIARLAAPKERDLDPVPVSRKDMDDIIEAIRCLTPVPDEED